MQTDKKHVGAMTALAELAMMQGQKAQATTWLERASAEKSGPAGTGHAPGHPVPQDG
ncbi:hypothetical protein LP419_18385 [Massilia sp. H-1]|nr:hypothetical protein LP419_18385 [Massilia sp. H-1]